MKIHLLKPGILLCILINLVDSIYASPQLEVHAFPKENGTYSISCHGGSDGEIDAIITGGIEPYSFVWTSSTSSFTSYSKNLTGLPTGTYTITVTDASGVQADDEVTLTEPDELSVNLEPSLYEAGFNVRCQGCDDGNMTAHIYGGTPPYQYSWSTTSIEEFIENLSAGSYSVVITDAKGCTASASQVLTQPTPLHFVSVTSPTISGSSNMNITCPGGNDGRIIINVSGGGGEYFYQCESVGEESSPSNTYQFNDLAAGDYTIRVTDELGITIETVITLNGPSDLTTSLSRTTYPNNYHLSCHNCNNGVITAIPSGGTSPYSYTWNNSATTSTISNLHAGEYSVTITDANGCSLTNGTTLNKPEREDWSMQGNAGTNPTTQFMGTTDNKDFVFKTNNSESLRLLSNGKVKIASLAGTGERRVKATADGTLIFDGPSATCFNLGATDAWYGTAHTGQYGGLDVINCNQSFGFGIVQPQERVHIAGFTRFGPTGPNYLNIGFDGNSRINSYGNSALFINDNSAQNLSLCLGGGIVSIGQVTPSGPYKLFVRGGIRTESVKVDLASLNNWADYVFQSDYKLRSLYEVETFIKINKHLPDISSAKELQQNGIDLLEMDSKLLAKIEELTLYLIEQDKKIKILESKIK